MICFCNSCYAPLNPHYEYARAFNNLACQCLFSTRRRCHEFVWILSQFCLFPLLIFALESVSFGESAPFFFRKHLHSSRVWIRTHLTRKCCESHFIMDKCGCLQSSRRALKGRCLSRRLPPVSSSLSVVCVCVDPASHKNFDSYVSDANLNEPTGDRAHTVCPAHSACFRW